MNSSKTKSGINQLSNAAHNDNKTFFELPMLPMLFPNEISIKDAILIVLFCLIFIVGVIGNAHVCFVFGFKKSRGRTTTESLILYLGIVDLLASIFNPPLHVYWTATKHSVWHFGLIGCKIIPIIGPIMTCASAGILCLIAVDRFAVIVLPFRGQLSRVTVSRATIATLVLSTLMYIHYSYALTIDDFLGVCMIEDISALSYMLPNITSIILKLLLFSLVFIVTNVMIFVSLEKQTNKLTLQKVRIKRLKENKRTMGVLHRMGLVFVVLIYPREIFQLYINFSWIIDMDGSDLTSDVLNINSWLFIMHASNSCANVFIYAHMHNIYRTQFLKIFSCFKRNNHKSKEAKDEIFCEIDGERLFCENKTCLQIPVSKADTIHQERERSISMNGCPLLIS